MKKFKTKLFGILTAVTLLAGAIPAHAESATIHVEGETGYNYSQGADTVHIVNESGATLVLSQTFNAEKVANGQVYFEYEVYTGSAGTYTMNWRSSIMSGNQYVSKTALSVNGDDVIATQLDGPSGTYNLGNHTANIYFDAGINTVRFTVKAMTGNDASKALFCLDYFEAIPETAKRYEAETYMTSYGSGWVSHASMKFNVANAEQDLKDGKVYCEQTVDVPKSGIYKLTWKGTLLGGSKYVSPVTLTVNGTSVTSEKDTSYDGTQYYQTADVVLSEGENTVRYTINGFRGNGGQAVFQLDYIELEYVDSAVRYGALKYDDIGGNATSGLTGLYGGYMYQMFLNGSNTYTLDLPEGTYDMYVGACSSVWTSYLGTLSFKLGDGEYMDFSGSNVTKGEPYKKTDGTNTDIGGHFKYNQPITLTEKTTIEFKCTAKAVSGSNTNILFDYFELVPRDVAIKNADITVESNKMTCGTEMQAVGKLYYENGYECGTQVIKKTVYSSSNTIVATVDENGVITGKNPGSATITVTYNDTYSASVNITVYDESGIIPISSNYDGTNAVIKLTRVANTTGTADVIIGAYSQKDGVNTSLKDVDPVTDVNPAYGNVVTVQREIAGDKISAFIWDSIEGMKPITDVITLK